MMLREEQYRHTELSQGCSSQIILAVWARKLEGDLKELVIPSQSRVPRGAATIWSPQGLSVNVAIGFRSKKADMARVIRIILTQLSSFRF
jgi:hypothetical protein